MRVDSLPNAQAAIRTNVADLMSRLETGDVIKAKVLEVTSDKCLLRLFDGSVLSAAAGEDLEAKVGQTLTLTVTSKSEGTLLLETLKDPSQINAIKPDQLKNILAALNLKTTAKSLGLAAEFIKAGLSPTKGQFENALNLMTEYKSLNAEKAVFMTQKGIQADQASLNLLSKLLDGDLKLGDQLKELQVNLNNLQKTSKNTTAVNTDGISNPEASTLELVEKPVSNNLNTAAAQKNIEASSSMSGTQPTRQIQKSPAAENTETTISNPQGKSIDTVKGSFPSSASKNTATVPDADSRLNTLKVAAQKNGKAQTSAVSINTSETAASAQEHLNNRHITDSEMTSVTGMPEDSAESIRSSAKVSNEKITVSNRMSGKLADDTTDTAAKAATSKSEISSSDISTSDTSTSDTSTSDTSSRLSKSDHSGSGSFSKLKDAIKDLFVRLESGKLTGEQDLSKLHNELYDKLDILRTTIHNSGISGLSGGEGVTAAANLLDDSVKLLSQLNNNNVLYYQMPVNLSGQNTTAELYIMKRQQNKKRIDPHNSVMFISLDTNNMGRFETLIDVKQNNVTMNFRTEKQEINDFIKENIKYLYKGFSESGYKLADVRYAIIDSATPPLKLEQLLSKMMKSNHSKLDMRI